MSTAPIVSIQLAQGLQGQTVVVIGGSAGIRFGNLLDLAADLGIEQGSGGYLAILGLFLEEGVVDPEVESRPPQLVNFHLHVEDERKHVFFNLRRSDVLAINAGEYA